MKLFLKLSYGSFVRHV